MIYEKHKRESYSVLLRTVLIILLPVFSIQYNFAQLNESISHSNLNASSSIYIISNREIDTTLENLSFNNEVSENTQLSFLKATLNTSDKIVSQSLQYKDFTSEISTKKSDWLLFVHGDSKTYNQSVRRGLEIQNLHKINVIVFSWPSKSSDLNGLKNLNISKKNVLKSKNHFNEVLRCMESFKKMNKAFNQDAKLSLFLHSLGNLYLKNLVKDANIMLKPNTLFENVIINSAAVNQKKHKDWVEKINFQKRIYITNNKSDFTLKGKHIFSKDGNQLGEKAKAPIAKNANYVHLSKAVGFRFPTGTTHTYFIGTVPIKSQNIRNFYFEAFHGNQIDFSLQSQFIKRKKEVGYDLIF